MNDVFAHALTLHQRGRGDEAAAIYRQVLANDPAHAGAWHLLGLYLQSQGDTEQACEHLEKALSLCKTKAVYWNNYGAVLNECGRIKEAKVAFERALSMKDEYPDAWSNLGLVQTETGDLDEAEGSLRHALRLAPRHADALRHLAVVYRKRGRYEEALRFCQDAAAVSPGNAAVYNVQGGILGAMRRVEEAADCYRKAISVNPNSADAHLKLGRVSADLDDMPGARAAFSRAAALRLDRAMWRLRHLSLCPVVFETSEEITEYRAELERQLDVALTVPPSFDWRNGLVDGFTPSFQLAHHGVCNRQLKEKYARLFAPHFPKDRPKCRGGGKIRVGFLCTAGHQGGYLRGYGGIMARLDRSRFEVVGLVSNSILAKCRQAIPANDIRWLGFPHNLPRACTMIRATECDIVAHRHADTDRMNYFLPFLPLAPVQVIGTGMHGTTGIPNIDYGISSRLFERGEEAADDYCETLVPFEGIPWWQRRPQVQGEPTREDFGLPRSGAVYFCPQRSAKLLPDFDELIRKILDGDGRGHVVVLKGRRPGVAEKLQSRLQRRLGQPLAKRVLFLPRQPLHEYYRLLSLATVVLDTPNYSTAFTGFDALGLGVPLVTKPGPLMVQRYAMGLYRAMGMEDLVTWDDEAYIATAVRLGRDAAFREAMSAAIRTRSQVLFEQPAVIWEYERFFEHVTREAVGDAGKSPCAAVNQSFSGSN